MITKIKTLFDKLPKRESQDALRLALQSAVSGASMFVIMQFWNMPEKFVGVLSAVLVVQTSVGNTLTSGIERFVATLVGCAIGLCCVSLVPPGYGTALSLAVSMFVMNAVVGFRPEWRYGVVAAVALSLGTGDNIWEEAQARTLAILIGVLVGILASLLVWPEKASSRACRHMDGALRSIADYLDCALENTQSSESNDIAKARNRYTTEISAARDCAAAVKLADDEGLNETISLIERLQSSVLIINRVADTTDNVAGEDDGVAKTIEDLKKTSSQAALALANHEKGTNDNLSSFKDSLSKLRGAIESKSEQSNRTTQQQTLAFGLQETLKTLEALLKQRT